MFIHTWSVDERNAGLTNIVRCRRMEGIRQIEVDS